jgi:diphosphomevalonate decarboxylase
MRATAKAQPNIALVKYWGKRDTERNLPATGSISITLDDLYTEMSVEFPPGLDTDNLTVNGETGSASLPRVSRCLDELLGPGRGRAQVSSRSNFPIAAGLASSASAFAALVVAAAEAAGQQGTRQELARQAGRASGSAARSLYGGFVELRNDGDEIRVSNILTRDQWPLRILAAVTTTSAKPVSSGEAMEISRKTSPFYKRWVDEQDMDLATARDAIAVKDFGKLASVAEHNCLKMHSVMWTSRPPVVYWNAATVACLETIRELQHDGIDVFFTIDAGPQVKAICLPDEEEVVANALADVAGVQDVLASDIGEGATLVPDP